MKAVHSRSAGAERGFSLIELMIVVAIVAILAAVAYPAYQTQIAKTNRSAAKACLAQYSQFMERYYTTQLTYVGAAPVLGCATESGLDKRYTFSVSNLAASTYTATATPTTIQSAKDSRCGTMTLNQTGARTAGTGSAADIAYCW
jgi:type IV pilus assembly protein PilE